MSCLPTSHCEFSKDGPPIPVEGEDDIEFLPHLDYLGQRQLVVGPVEVGGKIRAQCRQADHVLDPEVLVLHTGDPVTSLLAEVSVRPVEHSHWSRLLRYCPLIGGHWTPYYAAAKV